jgi:hypothetical protein
MWQYRALLLQIILGFLSRSQPGHAVNTHSNMNLLMVGNSFSEVHNLEEMIQAMLQERKMLLQAESIFAARFEVGGANMTHYANSGDLAKMIEDRDWTWIVLQEQSQTPGFCDDEPINYQEAFNYSLASMMTLNDKIQDDGATTILYETWGYFDTDPYNPDLFPDYPTMQEKLTKGYQIYYDNILKKNPKAKVKIAPAGLAYNRIFEDIQDKGEDPYKEGSLFEKLYMPVAADEGHDGNMARKYPTLAGAYLCACVLFQTISGLDIRQSSFTPIGLDYAMRDMLQKVAYDTVVEFNGGTAPGAGYDMQKTKPPYRPSYESSSSYSDENESQKSSGRRWVFAIVLVSGGLASYWVAEKRRSEITVQIPRNYGWNLVSSDESASMELSDMPSIQRV